MIDPPQRLERESPRAYRNFLAYVEMGPTRSLRKLAKDKNAAGLGTLGSWSTKFDWTARADEYQIALELHWREVAESQRAAGRAELLAKLPEAVETLIGLAQGRVSQDPEHSLPVLDRHGEEIGRKPLVSPGIQLQAVNSVLDRIGLIAPKRIEIDSMDRESTQDRAREEVKKLDADQIRAMLAVAEASCEP
jgi:hypothetical protein